eukprot:542373_1
MLKQLLSLYVNLILTIGYSGICQHNEYCIIGAGPAGIQMAAFFENSNRDYIVYEKHGIAGSFFAKYPRHRTLLSINKRFTGRNNHEFNLRHDWNSLLSHNTSLLFTSYSSEYFPSADDLVTYFNDYAQYLLLNKKIKYNSVVSNIEKQSNLKFRFVVNGKVQQTCNYLILATGRSRPNILSDMDGLYENSIGYEDMDLNPISYKNKSVAILGGGNTAFEIADSISNYAAYVSLYVRKPPKLSFLTHYVGDIRAINAKLFDQYQLKSLDSIIDIDPFNSFTLHECNNASDGQTGTIITSLLTQQHKYAPNILYRCWNFVIRALGWTIDPLNSIFLNIKPQIKYLNDKKWIDVSNEYESVNIKDLYVIGDHMQIREIINRKKSSSGFLHGFRYLIQALFHILEYKNYKVDIPYIWIKGIDLNQTMEHLLQHFVMRINQASAPYQMFGIIGDIAIFNDMHTNIKYSNDILLDVFINKKSQIISNNVDFITWNFEYGDDFQGCKVISKDRIQSGLPQHAHCSGFLHPVFRFYHNKNMIYDFALLEDVTTDWTNPILHIHPIREWLYLINQRLNKQNWKIHKHQPCFESI